MSKPPIIDDENSDEPARYHPPGGSQAGGPVVSETKFTPGPWQVNGVRHTGDLKIGLNTRLHFVGPDDDAVAAAFFDMKTGKGFADARLISAAPDMYEALQDALALANPDLDIPEDAHGRWKILARAALAKARGEA